MSYQGDEFRIQKHVSDLTKLLGSDEKPHLLYKRLQESTLHPQNLTPPMIKETLTKLAQNTESEGTFKSKYQVLRDRQVEKLDVFLLLISKIKENPALLIALKPKGSQAAIRSLSMATRGLALSNSLDTPILNPKVIYTPERPYLGNLFLPPQGFPAPHYDPEYVRMGSLPLHVQDRIIVEEILFLMLGMEGMYLRAEKSKVHQDHGISFLFDVSMNPSLADLVKKVTPLCSAYVGITMFVETYSKFEAGMVSQAFCAAIRELLKEYAVLVAQLETQLLEGILTLQKLWFYVQPSLGALRKIEALTRSISRALEKGGGGLLGLLYDRFVNHGGDEDSRKLYLYFLQKASVPYFQILENWVYKGVIHDPYGEFMIAEDPTKRKENLKDDYEASYWKHRYNPVREQCPNFLQPIQTMILETGKYINVIQECGVNIKYPHSKKLTFSPESKDFVDEIKAVHTYASQTLLQLLLHDHRLHDHLRCVRRYFLLYRGDYLVNFFDLAEEELSKSSKEISTSKMQSLLEIALKSSGGETDTLSDDLKLSFAEVDLMEELINIVQVKENQDSGAPENVAPHRGIDTFTLDYNSHWPVSLVLDTMSMVSYQFLFRHLFNCKRIERQLCMTWMTQSLGARGSRTARGPEMRRAQFLRQQMLTFIQTLLAYFTVEVLEPGWQKLEEQLEEATAVDHVLQFHTDFLKSSLRECMLTKISLLQATEALFSTCLTFIRVMHRMNQNISQDRRFTQLDAGFDRELGILENKFSQGFRHFITELNLAAKKDQYLLNNLISRLDFSGYYFRSQPYNSLE